MASLTELGICPPLSFEYLIPKSPFSPPGLCDAERIKPPFSLFFLIITEPAGVDTNPFCATTSFFTPFAAESLIIFCALFLCKLLAMPQGIWIVLTVIFIYMIRQPGESSQSLVRQRIFSVPAGILLGGIYSGSAVAMDYRLAYLMPLIGAAGFFMLYYRHNFFSFSLFFMFAFTIYADWMSGTFRTFNFAQFLLARTLATIIGAVILLTLEKISSISYGCGKAAV